MNQQRKELIRRVKYMADYLCDRDGQMDVPEEPSIPDLLRDCAAELEREAA